MKHLEFLDLSRLMQIKSWPMSRLDKVISLLGLIFALSVFSEAQTGCIEVVCIILFGIIACRIVYLVCFPQKVFSSGKWTIGIYKYKNEYNELEYKIKMSGPKDITVFARAYEELSDLPYSPIFYQDKTDNLWYWMRKYDEAPEKLGERLDYYLYADSTGNNKKIIRCISLSKMKNMFQLGKIEVDEVYYKNIYIPVSQDMPLQNMKSNCFPLPERFKTTGCPAYFLLYNEGKYFLHGVYNEYDCEVIDSCISAPIIIFKRGHHTIVLERCENDGEVVYKQTADIPNEFYHQTDEILDIYDSLNKLCFIYKFNPKTRKFEQDYDGRYISIYPETNEVII